MDKEELKQRCLNVIEEHRDEIIALGKEAYKTPELKIQVLHLINLGFISVYLDVYTLSIQET